MLFDTYISINYAHVSTDPREGSFLTLDDSNRLREKIVSLEHKQDEIAVMKLKHETEMAEMRQQLNKIVSLIQGNPKLARVKTDVLTKI